MAFLEAKRNLAQYLQQNRISLELSMRIQSLVLTQYCNMTSAKRIHEQDVSLLNFLPRSLQEQMHTEVFQPHLTTHPLFILLADSHERVFIKICHNAMSQESLKPGEELFTYGKEAEKVYIVDCGCCFYCEGSLPSQNKTDINAGDWLCEQVLWMPWVHRGQITAGRLCELANIDGVMFREIVAGRPLLRSICSRIAQRYLAIINENEINNCCNDLRCCSHETLQNIISTESGSLTD